MHSSRKRTARLLTVSGSVEIGRSVSRGEEGLHLEGVWVNPPPGHVTCDACWEANPSTPIDRQTPVKTLPFSKLRLRVLKKHIGLNQTELLQRPTTDLERKLSFSEWNSIEFVEDYF